MFFLQSCFCFLCCISGISLFWERFYFGVSVLKFCSGFCLAVFSPVLVLYVFSGIGFVILFRCSFSSPVPVSVSYVVFRVSLCFGNGFISVSAFLSSAPAFVLRYFLRFSFYRFSPTFSSGIVFYIPAPVAVLPVLHRQQFFSSVSLLSRFCFCLFGRFSVFWDRFRSDETCRISVPASCLSVFRRERFSRYVSSLVFI